MNKLAGLAVFIWVVGWTVAAIWAERQARTPTCPSPARSEPCAGLRPYNGTIY